MTTLPPLPDNAPGCAAWTAVQRSCIRAYGAACAAAAAAEEKERAVKLCEEEAAAFGGVVLGKMATDYGKLVHEAMAAGALNCAAAIRGDDVKESKT